MRVFIDESAWIAIVDPENSHHQAMRERFERSLREGDTLFTHNVAMGLALESIRQKMGPASAFKFNETIEDAYTGAHLTILWVGRRTQKEAGRLLRSKPELNLSIFGFAAYQMMKRRRILSIMTTKKAYRHLGLDVIPEAD